MRRRVVLLRHALLAPSLLGLLGLLGLLACDREDRRFREIPPTASADAVVSMTALQPGPATPGLVVRNEYEENAWAVAEGKRLFAWYNCVGCHAHGGGGMGPPLMDSEWIYGSEPENIFATIVEGRPNGMPSFGGHIPTNQVWQLTAYVRSMSGLLRKDVRPGRLDDMMVKPPEIRKDPERPVQSTVPPASERP